jgi:integrase
MRYSKHFKWVGDGLYKHKGKYYARVYISGRRSWRCTGKDTIKEARDWVKQFREGKFALRRGYESPNLNLVQKHVTLGKLIDDYIAAGCPTRKMRSKKPQTVNDEARYLRVARSYFADMSAASLSLADCDKYHKWRMGGGYISRFKVRGHDVTLHTKGGNSAVDHELTALSDAINLAVRRRLLKANPLQGRARYASAADVRHCREVAPTPTELTRIAGWLRNKGEHEVADAICFMAYTGLRIGEALPLRWDVIKEDEQLINVQREKRGIMPWVPITTEVEALLRDMAKRRNGDLLFPSPFDATKPRDASAVRRWLKTACEKLSIGHRTPHGLRSHFVTQARQSGLTDAEIAMLIGDKTGPAIIAQTYGDVRPDHLLAQARRIQFGALGGSTIGSTIGAEGSNEGQSDSYETNHVQDTPKQPVKPRALHQPAAVRTAGGIPLNH